MQRIIIFLIGLAMFGPAQGYTEIREYPFILSGTIAIDTGTVELVPIGIASYYQTGLALTKVKVTQGKFTFKGFISNPCGFKILLSSGGNYLSGVFFVERGNQIINCNIDSMREIPYIHNSTMEEFTSEYLPGIIALRKKFIDYDRRNFETKQYLLNYTKSHPNSYVSLWELVNELRYGYQPVLDSAYILLSKLIRVSYPGKILKQELNVAGVTSVGRKFPILKVQDINGKNELVPLINGSFKYIFIDFWFSHCVPCLGEFAEYKTIYAFFKSRGFEMIGVSSDFRKDIPAWKKVVRDNGLLWKQYLDKDRLLSKKLGIYLFPSNFLLDGNGRIIETNIQPIQLKAFLNQKLNGLVNKNKVSVLKVSLRRSSE